MAGVQGPLGVHRGSASSAGVVCQGGKPCFALLLETGEVLHIPSVERM